MQHRLLMGCVVATAILLGADILIHLFAAQLNRAVLTRLGEIPVSQLLAVFVAMFAGAAIARRRFRWIAVTIAAIVWLATVASVALHAEPGGEFGLMLRYSALGLVLSLAMAWLGGWLGERVSQISPAPGM